MIDSQSRHRDLATSAMLLSSYSLLLGREKVVNLVIK